MCLTSHFSPHVKEDPEPYPEPFSLLLPPERSQTPKPLDVHEASPHRAATRIPTPPLSVEVASLRRVLSSDNVEIPAPNIRHAPESATPPGVPTSSTSTTLRRRTSARLIATDRASPALSVSSTSGLHRTPSARTEISMTSEDISRYVRP